MSKHKAFIDEAIYLLINSLARSDQRNIKSKLTNLKRVVDAALNSAEFEAPNIKDIRNIFKDLGLNPDFFYFRDKRSEYTRIKIYLDNVVKLEDVLQRDGSKSRLSTYEVAFIDLQLSEKYPNYEFACGFDFTQGCFFNYNEKVLVIKFREKN